MKMSNEFVAPVFCSLAGLNPTAFARFALVQSSCLLLKMFVFVKIAMKLLVNSPKRSILVGGLEHFLFFHILGIIIPTD